jgi:hypothetical protein
MKKSITFFALASLAAMFSACGGPANTAVNNTNTNTIAAKVETPLPTATPTPRAAVEAKGEVGEVEGELQIGGSESVILYVGEETGDYAGYCFSNDSEAGKAILAACKDKMQCEVTGTINGSVRCKVPGLEADLSGYGRITSVTSVRSLGKRK